MRLNGRGSLCHWLCPAEDCDMVIGAPLTSQIMLQLRWATAVLIIMNHPARHWAGNTRRVGAATGTYRYHMRFFQGWARLLCALVRVVLVYYSYAYNSSTWHDLHARLFPLRYTKD